MTGIDKRFDRRASHYDNPLTAFIGEQELRQVRPFVPAGSRVLDYGCGTGRTTLDLLRLGCQVTAFDISKEMLALACQKASAAGHDQEACEWVTDPAVLAGRQWPVITLIGVLDYYPDPLPLLKIVRTYLAPGGRLVTTFPQAFSPLAWLYVLSSRFTVAATARTPAFARRTAVRAGLSVLTMRYAYPGVPILGHTLVVVFENKS